MSLLVPRRPASYVSPSVQRLLACRRYISVTVPPVGLAYDMHIHAFNPDTTRDPFLIAHGLFGSKRNWTSISKQLAKLLQRPIIPIDLRNFGDSPQSEVMDYSAQAGDILHFCRTHGFKNVSLLGHSMGGKAAMTLALNPELPRDLLRTLIIADISPIRGILSDEFRRYLDGMIKLEQGGKAKSKKEAFEALEEVERDPLIRHFLLTNLDATHHGHPVQFRIPLDIIRKHLDALGDFPYEPGEAHWDGPTLFIKGSKSNYIKEKNLDIMKSFFPSMELQTLDAGHWVHYERPKEFIRTIVEFVKKHDI